MRVWSRELGSAVPSRVSPLILHTQAESDVTYGNPLPLPAFRYGFHQNHAMRHRASTEFIIARNCVPMAFTTENPPLQDQQSQGSSINGSFLFR